MLKLFLIFAVGFVSDFLIVLYYQYIMDGKISGALVCNSIMMIINIFFIGLAIDGSVSQLLAYLIGQNIGICCAIKYRR